MKGYVVCVYKNIKSEVKLKEYAVKARAAVENLKENSLWEEEEQYQERAERSPRTVVIEFPSYEEANAFYISKEYQDAHSILMGFADRQFQTIDEYWMGSSSIDLQRYHVATEQ